MGKKKNKAKGRNKREEEMVMVMFGFNLDPNDPDFGVNETEIIRIKESSPAEYLRNLGLVPLK